MVFLGPSTSEKNSKHNLEYVIRSGVAGGVAGCAAKTLIAPLDRVKILFQTGEPQFKKWAGTMLGLPRAAAFIVKSEGFNGLFRGHSATLARIFPYAATKFVAYEQVRAVLIPNKSCETHLRRFASGSLAGLASVIVTYPLDVVRVQLAYMGSRPEVQKSQHRLWFTIKELWKREPAVAESFLPKNIAKIANFYSGFVPTLLGIVPYAGVSFFAHDIGHDIFRSKILRKISVNDKLPGNAGRPSPLKGWAELLAGGFSGVVAQTSAYPLEVVRRRMQVAAISGQSQSLASTVKGIYRELGIRGFFIGLSIGYIKVAPMFACSFYVYEQMKYMLRI